MYTGPVHRPVYPYMHIPCIQALSGYGQDRYIQACNIHSQPMLPGLCTQGLAIPAQDRPTTGDTGILEQASTP